MAQKARARSNQIFLAHSEREADVGKYSIWDFRSDAGNRAFVYNRQQRASPRSMTVRSIIAGIPHPEPSSPESIRPMLTLHHLETSRSQRILWLLEELQVPYQIVHYKRDKKTRLAPPELKAIHPLGKSPVITDRDVTVAESGAILEYLVEQYGSLAKGELAHLQPKPGTMEHRQCRFWMHYAEGSLMNWLVMRLVFTTIPTQPMPFFVRPIARQLCAQVRAKLVDPNVATALAFIDNHLASHKWFAGDDLTVADFQMSFPVEAALARGDGAARFAHMAAYRERMVQRPAYQRAIKIGGPVVMS